MLLGLLLASTAASAAPPSKPVNLSPANWSQINGTSVTMQWQYAANVQDYYVRVGRLPSFTSEVVYASWLGGNFTGLTLTNMPDNGQVFFWQILAWNSDGQTWGDVSSFYSGPSAPPTTPVLQLPANGSNQAGTSVAFQWALAARAADYYFQLATDPSFSEVLYGDWLGGVYNGITITGLPDNGLPLYWRVAAWNAAGTTPYSSTRFVYNGPSAPPATPVPTSPANGATVNGTQINFDWNPAARASGYDFQLADHPSFSPANLLVDDAIGNYSGITITGLPDNGTLLYWRVAGSNALGTSAWSAARSVRNGPSAAPGAPSIVAPSGYAGGDEVEFEWLSAPRANDYFLELSLDPGFSASQQLFGEWIGDYVGITITNMPDDGTLIYWRVRGRNSLGNGPYDTASFTNGPSAAPGAPSLVSPTHLGNAPGETIQFRWNPAPRASDYGIEVAIDAAFTQVVFAEWIGDYIGLDLSGFPDAGFTYYWRVIAANDLGESPYSPVWRVVNGPSAVPAAPVPVLPPQGSNTGGTTVLFQWNQAARANNYYIQVALDSAFTSTVFADWIGNYIGLYLSGLPDDGTVFYWRVRASNALGQSPFSVHRVFTNGPSAVPGAVALSSPGNGSSIPGSVIAFTWSAAARAADYRFVLATDPGLSNVLVNTTSGGFLGIQVSGFPQNGTAYYWRVNGINSVGSGPPSPIWTFTSGTAPPPPTSCTPQTGTGSGNVASYSHVDSCFETSSSTYFLKDFTRRATVNPHAHNGLMPDTSMIVTERALSATATEVAMDANNAWVEAINRSGVDAQVNAGRVYDQLLKIKYAGASLPGLNSINGLGMTIRNIFSFPTCDNNAFFFSSTNAMYYCAIGHQYAAALDVVGHEIGHGVTALASTYRGSGSELVYENESGALNEAFSDWLGTTVESYYKPLNWTLGDPVNVIRNLSNPLLHGQPDTYGGTNWFDWTTCVPSDTNDYCGVHRNSGVGNKAFYLLSDGGTHATSGVAVQGLGVAKAIEIALRANLKHWSTTERYLGAANGMVSASSWIYGATSNETHQVKNAWAAVNVLDLPRIDLSALPAASGSVSGGGEHEWGKSITVVATPNTGYAFQRWKEGATEVSTSPSYTFTVTDARTLVAEFGVAQYQVSVVASPPSGGSVSGGGTFNHGATATVVATPAAGHDFSGWYEGGVLVSSNASYAFSVTSNRTLEARFAARRSLTLSSVPALGGTIQALPAPGPDGKYANGTTVTLTPIPNPNYTFTSWSGDASGSLVPVQIVLSANRSVTANFQATSYGVSLSVNPAGAGTVSGSGSYSPGSTATISASANAGYFFAFWTGGVNSVLNPEFVQVNSNIVAVAQFGVIGASYNVNVSVSPPGSGTVTGGGTYSSGATATLTATPAAGRVFVGWTGDLSGSQNPISVRVIRNLNVTANFALPDTVPPVVTPPANVSVTATGELTPVALGAATAVDAVDGPLVATPSQVGPFPPGTHVITWSATDSAGNTGTATQLVIVTPLVGDVKLDGRVDVADVMVVSRILKGTYTPTAGELQRADVAPIVGGASYPDGAVNGADMAQILRIVAGVISP